MPWTVYCHIHTDSGRRYVGLTAQPWQKRWKNHVAAAKAKDKDGRWHFPNTILKYGKDAFSHEVLEVCDTLETANAAEEKWINHFNTRDPLFGFNIKKGGFHTPHPIKNPWDRPEYRAKCIPNLIAITHTPEARAKSKASLNTPESKAKRSAATKAALANPEIIAKRDAMRTSPAYGEKISQSLKATLDSSEIRAQMSSRSKDLHQDPEYKSKVSIGIRAAYQDPIVKEHHRQAVIEAQNRPELLALRRSYRASDKTREKLAISSTGRKHSPESIAKMKEIYWKRRNSLLSIEHE